jgi:hypothetical protein
MDPILIAQGLQRLQKERDGWREEATRLRAERDNYRAALIQQGHILAQLNSATKIWRKKAKDCSLDKEGRKLKTQMAPIRQLAPIPEVYEPAKGKLSVPGLSITTSGGCANSPSESGSRWGGARVKRGRRAVAPARAPRENKAIIILESTLNGRKQLHERNLRELKHLLDESAIEVYYEPLIQKAKEEHLTNLQIRVNRDTKEIIDMEQKLHRMKYPPITKKKRKPRK